MVCGTIRIPRQLTNQDIEVLTHLLSHLTPSALSAMSLVSKRFHTLVTTPHAWRIAFSRYFLGPDAMVGNTEDASRIQDDQQIFKSNRRSFSRLSALASWRSEYILRTRLFRSLARGKPVQFQSVRAGHPRNGSSTQATAVTTYGSGLLYPISHIHATFGIGLNKKQPLFIHGASEQGLATASDPAIGKIDNWGVNDHQVFRHFADLYLGDAEYGLGTGDVVGMPNVMDLSQQYGKIYGEASPGGQVFFTAVGEQRGPYLQHRSSPNHELGIPEVDMIGCSVCSVWIGKSDAVLKLTCGVFGMLAGFSNGILVAYAVGSYPLYDRRFDKGEPTAKWALCPGVPIIAIQVDDQYSSKRHSQKRIWAVALNALGEVFYLTDLPSRPATKARISPEEIDQVAWETGRSVAWTMIEGTRRVSRPDPFNTDPVDGSYSPTSSAKSLGLSKDQLMGETKEIERFLAYRPKHFRKLCEDWNMRRKLHVDFAGIDDSGAGESILVIDCGFEEDRCASIRRLTRRKFKVSRDFDLGPYPSIQTSTRPSLFGGPLLAQNSSTTTPSSTSTPRSRTSSQDALDVSHCSVEWFISEFGFGGLRSCQVSATAIDESTFAVLTANEDPLLGMNGDSNASSPMLVPLDRSKNSPSAADIPGQRGRFLAVGLTTGAVILWNMRVSVSPASDIINKVAPVRIIHTESPQISCLALTSLYVVHGGSDGLVQAWDPLASTLQPVRTLNSRFSSRARRRLIQAGMSYMGVGHNYYAAGAIVLDPDPTVLRGMVGLGTHLRYWSYSSSAADQYKAGKRKLRRRSERGSNAAHGEQRFTHSGRGVLKDYIAVERLEMEREKAAKHKEKELLKGRFGTELLGPGAGEEEILAYATMLSEESYSADEVKRRGSNDTSAALSSTSGETLSAHDTSLPLFEQTSSESSPMTEPQEPATDVDIAEAIRLSLLDQPTSSNSSHDISTTSYYDVPSPARDLNAIPIRYGKKQSRLPKALPLHGSSGKSPSYAQAASPSVNREEDDLDFALRLSLAEEESRKAQQRGRGPQSSEHAGNDTKRGEDEYPELERNVTARRDEDSSSKGKGRAAW